MKKYAIDKGLLGMHSKRFKVYPACIGSGPHCTPSTYLMICIGCKYIPILIELNFLLVELNSLKLLGIFAKTPGETHQKS